MKWVLLESKLSLTFGFALLIELRFRDEWMGVRLVP